MRERTWTVVSNTFDVDDIHITGINLIDALTENVSKILSILIPPSGGPFKVFYGEAQWHHDPGGVEIMVHCHHKHHGDIAFVGQIPDARFSDMPYSVRFFQNS